MPIFYAPWWLNAAAGRWGWDVALIYGPDGQVTACWPYLVRSFWGLPIVDRPPLSPLCGPWLTPPPPDAGPSKRLSYYHGLLAELSAMLPRAIRYRSGSVYGVQYPSLLARHGWRTRQKFSYRLPTKGGDLDKVRQGYSSLIRRKLKGDYGDRIEQHFSPAVFTPLYAAVAKRRRQKPFFPLEAFNRLFVAADEAQRARCWVYRTANGETAAAVWLPYDDESAYLIGVAQDVQLATGEHPVVRLIDRAAEWCCARGITLDLEGSSIAGVEDFYRGFGPEIDTYVVAEKGW